MICVKTLNNFEILKKKYPEVELVKCKNQYKFKVKIQGQIRISTFSALKIRKSNKLFNTQVSKTRLYLIWSKMINRCKPLNNNHKKYYYDRGIKVCDEWLKSFFTFKDWAIANGYKENLTIDRIDNNGNYEPNNCRWATLEEQANNKRNNHFLTYNNETKSIQQWSKTLNIPVSTIYNRIKRNWNINDVLGKTIQKKFSPLKQNKGA